jgi:sec-independent protein translocase protein TatA
MRVLGLIGPLGLPELLVILVILILLFGARKIPDLARGLGEGIRNFRQGMKEGETPADSGDNEKLPKGS